MSTVEPSLETPPYQPHPARWLLVILGTIGINAGLAMFYFGHVPGTGDPEKDITGLIAEWLVVAGLMKLVFGMALFAKAKGRSAMWGALGLLGVFTWIGLLIMLAIFTRLENRLPHQAQASTGRSGNRQNSDRKDDYEREDRFADEPGENAASEYEAAEETSSSESDSDSRTND